MKGCELCDRAARMYCESDQASLCWECDARVHGANFLVARHSRSLLCRRCQSPTPWKAEGPRLWPTFSVCERCSGSHRVGGKLQGMGGEDEDVEEEEEEEDDGGDGGYEEDGDYGEEEGEGEGEGDGDGEGEEEDGDNQVVPSTLTPPPVASSSSSDESSSRTSSGSLKRMREDANLACQDNGVCSSSHSQPSYLCLAPDHSPRIPARPTAEDEATSFASHFRPSKNRRRAIPALAQLAGDRPEPAAGAPGSAAVSNRNHRDHQAVDLVWSGSCSPTI